MIHPSAIVHPGAKLGPGVAIGAYSIIGGEVELGADTEVGSHVVIEGRTRIGEGNRIFPFCSIGAAPQDKKYAGEPTALEIGKRNTIREFCTFNLGTIQDAGVTRLGDDNWIMAYVHLAHDCQVGNHTVFANNAQLAGHVHIGDFAILGGYTLVHQFVSVGAHAITGLGTVLLQDLPPYVTAAGNTAKPYGINSEGLKRRGFAPETVAAIKAAYKTLYKMGNTLDQAKQALEVQTLAHPEVGLMLEFLRSSRRSILR